MSEEDFKRLGPYAMPCPFCAGKNIYLDSTILDEEENYFYVCVKCGCEGPYTTREHLAEILWNARAVPA